MKRWMADGPKGRGWTAYCLAEMVLLVIFDQSAAMYGQERDAAATDRAALRAEMRVIAESFEMLELSGEDRRVAQLADEPVLRYTDNTRRQDDATVWIWQYGGRPVAVMGIEFYPKRPREPKWLYEVVSLSPERIALERRQKPIWTSRSPGLQLHMLDDAPPPAEKPTVRLRQMKQLLQRFTAYERAEAEGRIELRPMAQPLVRYRDDATGIDDGAVFAFANGTNPEMLCVVEARREDKPRASWYFALAQMTGGEVFAELDGQKIWERPEANPPAIRDSFFNNWVAPSPAD